jgi:site-specific recombinase XerD
MAWLELRGTTYRVNFWHAGRHHSRSLKTSELGKAEASKLRLEETLSDLERGRLELPSDADLVTFLLSDGKVTQRPKEVQLPKDLSLGELKSLYVETHSHGTMEQNSLDTVRLHLRHFVVSLGETFPVQALTLGQLQDHVNRRVRKKGLRKIPISPTTLRKEVASFRACWNWGVHAGLLKGPFPNRGLKYPKGDEKPPFQTWEEIERQIQRGGLSELQQKGLWDCLFLTLPEIDQILAFVKGHARHAFLHPMFCFAAHTGARRSEMLRARINDVDLEGRTVLLHEKKRAKGKRTMRRVPLSDTNAAGVTGLPLCGHTIRNQCPV